MVLAIIAIVALVIPILVGGFLVGNLAAPYVGPAPPTTSITSAQPGSVSIMIYPGANDPSKAPGYSPDKVTLVVGVNNSVIWTNADSAPHTVTSSSVPTGASAFDSGNMPAGAKFPYTFTTPGTYQYLCSYHSWMIGTIVVVGGGGGGPAIAAVKVSIPVGANDPSKPPGFAPDKITVVIGVNNTVTWSNDDTAPHTVTSSSVPTSAKAFDSGNLASKATYSYTFTTPGTYQYTCSYHAWMTGTVVVVAGTVATPTTALKVSIPVGANDPSKPPGFNPDKITVVIGVNNTITWSNDDSAPHTVTSSSVPTGAKTFDSGNLASHATFTYTFTTPGTYQYTCSYHTWMTGTIVVKGP